MEAGGGIPGNSHGGVGQDPCGPEMCCQESRIFPRISFWTLADNSEASRQLDQFLFWWLCWEDGGKRGPQFNYLNVFFQDASEDCAWGSLALSGGSVPLCLIYGQGKLPLLTQT